MKKIVFLCLIVLLACEVNVDSSNGNGGNGTTNDSTETFWAIKDFNDIQNLDSYYKVEAVKQYENNDVVIYVEKKNIKKVPEALAKKIGEEYSNTILPKVSDTFYPPSDVNKDGKMTLLYLDISEGLDGGGYVAGYFFNGNYYTENNATKNNIRSNYRDMLYIDCVTQKNLDSPFQGLSTVAHELQHLVTFNYRVWTPFQNNQTQMKQLDFWISEGIAEQGSYTAFGYDGLYSRLFFLGRSDSFTEGRSMVYSTGTLESYAYSATYLNWVGQKSGNSKEFFNSVMKIQSGDITGVANLLTGFEGSSAQEKFDRSFVEWAGKGLATGSGYVGLDEYFNKNSNLHKFNGIQLNKNYSANYAGYAPVFHKNTVGTSITASGNNKLIDLSDSDLNIKSTVSLGEFNGLGYGVSLMYFPTLNKNETENFSVPKTLSKVASRALKLSSPSNPVCVTPYIHIDVK